MTSDGKKRLTLLRTLMVTLLIGFWLFVLVSREEVVWWFWFAPIPLLLIFYKAALRVYRCSECGRDFALKKVSHTPSGPLGGGRVHMKCLYCGEEETHSAGTGH